MQAKKYSDTKKCSIKNTPQHLLADTRVKKIISDGAESVGTIFIEYNKEKYTDQNFLKILEYIATQDVNQFIN